jgi:hypothetical protein
MLEVTSARYAGGYKVELVFNNGNAGVVDLTDALWGPVFEPLKDMQAFRQLTLSEVLHTICWNNGADFAPEFLYEKLIEQRAAPQVFNAKR